MSEPKGVTLERLETYCKRRGEAGDPEYWNQAAALVRAADRVVAAARRHVKYDTGDSADELEEALADFDRAGGGA